MGLREDIEQEVAPGGCSLFRAMGSLSTEDRVSLEQALAEDRKRIPDAVIVRVLRRHSISIEDKTVSSHRKGICRCRDLTTN